MRPLRLLSWNIHAGVGADGRYDLERIADIIRALEPDVAAFQEAVEPRRLAAALGMDVVVGEAPGVAFNALLTRLEVRDVGHADLSVAGREPRGILDVLVEHEGRGVRVLGTHFGLRARERKRQVDGLLGYLERDPVTDIVVLGDFNEWRPGSPGLWRLNRALGRTPALRTFPSRWPLLSLDRVWTRPRDGLRTVEAVRGDAAIASDHLPVVATFLPCAPRDDALPPSWLHRWSARGRSAAALRERRRASASSVVGNG